LQSYYKEGANLPALFQLLEVELANIGAARLEKLLHVHAIGQVWIGNDVDSLLIREPLAFLHCFEDQLLALICVAPRLSYGQTILERGAVVPRENAGVGRTSSPYCTPVLWADAQPTANDLA
jgi:hypothetical protein